jgi:RND family efflux transporter MFP subunit
MWGYPSSGDRKSRIIKVSNISMTSAQPPKLSRLRRLRLPLIIMSVTAGIIYVLVATRPQLVPTEAPERVWPVDVVEARIGTVTPELGLFGEVVAGRRTELMPLVSGVMVEIGENFREGGQVEKGELLLQIDPFTYEIDLAEQRSILKEGQIKLKMLVRDLERAKELFAAKNVSEQFLETAELDVMQQEAIIEQREIAVKRAKRDLSDTRLVAPFDGVVNKVNAALGKQFSGFGADNVGELIDTSRVEVKFSLTNSQYGRLLEGGNPIVGLPVRVLWTVGQGTLEYDAVIERIGAEIQSTTGGVDAFAVIETGGQQTELRPGAFVSVRLADKVYEDTVRVPDTALYGEDTVFVVKDGRLEERKIQVVGYNGTSVLFRVDERSPIFDGDQIVVTQVREGGAGSKVSVK